MQETRKAVRLRAGGIAPSVSRSEEATSATASSAWRISSSTSIAGEYLRSLVTRPSGVFTEVYEGVDINTFYDAIEGDDLHAVVTTGVEELVGGPDQAGHPRVLESRPNPFRQSTSIRYSLDRGGPTVHAIHDISGRLVRTLRDGLEPPGPGAVNWDGRDGEGVAVSPGVYLNRPTVGGRAVSRKITRLN